MAFKRIIPMGTCYMIHHGNTPEFELELYYFRNNFVKVTQVQKQIKSR